MKILKKQDGTTLEIALEGRLDTITAPELDQELKNSLCGITELILDFENLEYLSSAGLRVLLTAHKQMTTQGSMVVRNVSEIVQEVLEVTGFTSILTIE